jgi:hypothetical protein
MASEISMKHEVHKISVNDVAYHCVGDVCVAVERKTMVMKSALIKYSTVTTSTRLSESLTLTPLTLGFKRSITCLR